MKIKRELINKMLRHPISFNDDDLNYLIELGLDFDDLRLCIKRIYDLNENQFRAESASNIGVLGFLNRLSNKSRKKQYYKKASGRKSEVNYKQIFAEGDSWFQFPYFVTDVIDCLNKRKDYLIFCESAAGDWFTNIIYDSQIIPALSTYKPNYFLISGGGNDLAGNDKIACMVGADTGIMKFTDINQIGDTALNNEQKQMILDSQGWITKEFYAYLWVMKAQYILLFDNLYKPTNKHRNIVSITQGYDYAIPNNKLNFDIRYPYQPIINKLLGSGKWLFTPMMIRNIKDRYLQKAIMFTFINEFNLIFHDIASRYEKVYHIDCRGVAQNPTDWFDELHLKSNVYNSVAKAYMQIIDGKNPENNKIIWAKDFKNLK